MDRECSRPSTFPDPLSLPWTATRCHRLLRPLLTHISALRKEVNRQQQRDVVGNESSRDHAVSALGGRGWRVDNFADSHIKGPGSGTDASKLPSRKRVQHTYSLKACKRSKISNVTAGSSEISCLVTKRYAIQAEQNMCLTTPIIRRVQGQWSSPLVPEPGGPQTEVPAKAGRCYHSHGACVKRCSFEERLVSLKTTTPSSTLALYESIYRAFDALLRATTGVHAQVAKPASLMAMCLRRVPDYLAELESWRLHELGNSGTSSTFEDTNTSFDVYSDLESLGTGNCGWRHLAAVLQSHGIRIVRDAILERLLADEFAILLSDLCSELKAEGDRWQLLEAVLTQQQKTPHDSVENLCARTWARGSQALQLLVPRQKDRPGTAIFKARLTTDLLINQLLPHDWILSKVFADTCSTAMRHLTSRASYRDAIPFFVASISLLCSHIRRTGRKPPVQEEAVATAQQQLIKWLATLSTLVLLGRETLATASFDFTRRNQTLTLCKRTEYILRACLASAHSSRGRATRQASTYVLLLAVFLATETSTMAVTGGSASTSRETQMLAEFWARVEKDQTIDSYRQYYEATMALMASIAQCCTRKDSAKPAHTHLVGLCDKLETACPDVTALRSARVDAAFYLADLTGDLWDLNFAEQLAARQSSPDMSKTPDRRTAAFSGFRWDEGISEWVTVTPAVARRKRPLADRVTRARGGGSGDISTLTRDAECLAGRPSSLVTSSKQVLDIDVNDVSDLAEACQPCRASVRASPEPGTRCRAKPSPRKQVEPQTILYRDRPGQQTTKPDRPAARTTPEPVAGVGGIASPWDDDLDELRFDQADQENRPPGRRAAISCAPLKRKRSRRSLVSLRPVRNSTNEYYGADESSGDELGVV